jgi:uncharacterized membrane protein YkoI
VRDAIQRETKDATVKGLAKETQGDATFYEAETEVNGHSRDLLFDASEKLVEVEEETAVDAAPGAVKAALEKRGKIVKLETVTKGGRVTYEGVVEKSGKKSEVAVDADGKQVNRAGQRPRQGDALHGPDPGREDLSLNRAVIASAP